MSPAPSSSSRQVGRRGFLTAAGVATAGAGVGALGLAPAARADGADPAPATTSGRGFDRTSPRFALAVLPGHAVPLRRRQRRPGAAARRPSTTSLQERAEANIAFLDPPRRRHRARHRRRDRSASATFRRHRRQAALQRPRRQPRRERLAPTTSGAPRRTSRRSDRSGSPARRRFGGASPDGYNSYHVLDRGGPRVAGPRARLARVRRGSGLGAGRPRRAPARCRRSSPRTTSPPPTTTGPAPLSDVRTAAVGPADPRQRPDLPHPQRALLAARADRADERRRPRRPRPHHQLPGPLLRRRGDDPALPRSTSPARWSTSRRSRRGSSPRRRHSATPLAAETLELTGDVDRFSLEIDFAARFAGFAPVTPPPPRPASAVVPRDTLAYWRFDAAGYAAAGRRCGGGRRRARARPHRATATTCRCGGSTTARPRCSPGRSDHHDRPAGAREPALRRRQGPGPGRGAARPRPAAPINPASSCRRLHHRGRSSSCPTRSRATTPGWASSAGRGATATRASTSGYSPLEPTCSLNLSPERFLQYVVYPDDHRRRARPRGATPCPSAAGSTSRWSTTARRTVDVRRRLADRPQPHPALDGIATLGKPFALGGTSFDEVFGQGFYGWLGDVRIVEARPAAVGADAGLLSVGAGCDRGHEPGGEGSVVIEPSTSYDRRRHHHRPLRPGDPPRP